MAARKRMLNNSELKDILQEEMSPAGKILKIGLILSGGVNVNPYQIGANCRMHAAETHQAIVELRHRKGVERGVAKDTVNVIRSENGSNVDMGSNRAGGRKRSIASGEVDNQKDQNQER